MAGRLQAGHCSEEGEDMRKLAHAACGASLWLAMATSPQAAPCAGFTDVDDASGFCTSVAWMKNRAITLGCTASQYCPADFVRRDQMAVFLYRLGAQNAFLHGGNAFGTTAVLGTNDDQPMDLRVDNERVMRYEPNAISPNVIGGSPANSVDAGVRGATVAGGGVSPGNEPDFVVVEQPNRVTDVYGTVGGGMANLAGNDAGTLVDAAWATVAGGNYNRATGYAAAVGGGHVNLASGDSSNIPGGYSNEARGALASIAGGRDNLAAGYTSHVAGGLDNVSSGTASFVAGGSSNVASANYSFAAGHGAVADQWGCMVFANWGGPGVGTGSCLGASYIARFLLPHGLSVDFGQRRPDGGGTQWVYVGDLVPGQTIATWTGAYLSSSGVWNNASDRSLKDGFSGVDAMAVLEGVINLPVQRWHYRRDGPAIAHIGPTAQDFRAAFGLGDGDTVIGTVDADGVALAAIQGLNAKLDARLAERDAKLAEQAREIESLKRAIERLLAGRDR